MQCPCRRGDARPRPAGGRLPPAERPFSDVFAGDLVINTKLVTGMFARLPSGGGQAQCEQARMRLGERGNRPRITLMTANFTNDLLFLSRVCLICAIRANSCNSWTHSLGCVQTADRSTVQTFLRTTWRRTWRTEGAGESPENHRNRTTQG